MKQAIIALGFGVAATLMAAPITSRPAFAICNEICQSKCAAEWQKYFKSQKQCITVWSRRNGPTGLGCGAPGGPFQQCK